MSKVGRYPPPLAVIHSASRALGVSGQSTERLTAFCEDLQKNLPATGVRLHAGQRQSDRFEVGDTTPDKSICSVIVNWHPEREAVLEATGSPRPAAELRPILETLAALLATAIPSMERNPIEALDLERQLHRLTIDSLPVGLYVVDREYRIVLWNRKRETGTQGLRRGDVLGRPATEVLSRQDPDTLRAEFDLIFTHGEQYQSDQTVISGDDRKVYRITRIPMRLTAEEITHVITIGEDVTETRAIQRSMQQAEKLTAIGQLAAGVMHEVNNPLATIGACAAAVEGKLSNNSDLGVVQEYLDIITSEVERCTGIVNRLLGFARTEQSSADYQPLDVNDFLERTLYLIKPNTRFEKMHVVRDYAADLPRVLGNLDQLQQAAMIILINAADATGGHGTITVRSFHDDGRVILEFEDDGPGIPPTIIGKVFEPFFTTKGPGKGTGLGLAICYGLIADHSGSLEAQTGPQGGTLMRISLPAIREEAGE